MMLAPTPPPPYYAVIFSSIRTDVDDGYGSLNDYLENLAEGVDGFLGVESARNEIGVSVSYWRDLEAIHSWRNNVEHQKAKQKGRDQWYLHYHIRIARVEKDYTFSDNKNAN